MLKRYWINQPSTLQEFHGRHGENVLGEPVSHSNDYLRVYFLKGNVESMLFPKLALSRGWLEEEE